MPRQKQIGVTPTHFHRRLLPYHHLQVDHTNVHPDHQEIEITLDLVEEPPLVCSVCEESAAGIHRLLNRRVRDLNINGNKVYLIRPYRRIHCNNCEKIRSQKLDITRRNKEITNRFARYVDQLSEWHRLDRIAAAQDLAWDTVKAIEDESIPDPGPGQQPVLYALDVVRRNEDLLEVEFLNYLSGEIIERNRFRSQKKMMEWIEYWADNKSNLLANKNILLLSEQPLMYQILIDHVGANHVLRGFR